MNTRGGSDSDQALAFAVSFNSTRTSFVIAHDGGFSVFRAHDGDKVASSALDALKFATMIGNSQYVGVASLFGQQPGLANFDMGIYNARQQTMTRRRDDVKEIRALHLTEERAVVVCRTATLLFEMDYFERTATLETMVNETGVCCVGTTKLAIPGRRAGQVQVVELKSGRSLQIIAAHQSPIRAIELSEDEQYLATASDNGTLFRVFILPDATKVAELRRGIEQAKVFDIRMSPDNAFLAATSEKGTLHVFSLGGEPTEPAEGSHTPGSRQSGSPEPISIPAQRRKSSWSASPSPASIGRGRTGSASLAPSSPSRKTGLLPPLAADSPAEYVLVDASASSSKEAPRNLSGSKYSQLSKLPFAPSFMKAHYPDASSSFNVGPLSAAAAAQEMPGVPTRGQIKWIDEETFVVVRVQPTAFWEKFKVGRSPIDGALDVTRSAYQALVIP